VNDVDQGKHPDVSIGKAPDRLYTITHSEPYGDIYNNHAEKHAKINKSFQRQLDRSKTP
jgi:hypothetical protein